MALLLIGVSEAAIGGLEVVLPVDVGLILEAGELFPRQILCWQHSSVPTVRLILET